MVDLTNPSPLVMTHFELVGFICGVIGVIVTALGGYLGKRRRGTGNS